MTGKIIRPAPAEIEYRNMRFLITDQPQVIEDMYSSPTYKFNPNHHWDVFLRQTLLDKYTDNIITIIYFYPCSTKQSVHTFHI